MAVLVMLVVEAVLGTVNASLLALETLNTVLSVECGRRERYGSVILDGIIIIIIIGRCVGSIGVVATVLAIVARRRTCVIRRRAVLVMVECGRRPTKEEPIVNMVNYTYAIYR